MTSAQLVEAGGWTLIHFVWQGAAIGLQLGIVLAIVPTAKAQGRYVAGCAALLAMVAAAGGTLIWQASIDAAPSTAVAEQPANAESALASTSTPMRGDVLNASEAQVVASSRPPAHTDANGSVSVAGTTAGWRRTLGGRLRPWLGWLVSLWAVGVTALSGRLALNWRAARRLRASGRVVEHDAWTSAIERLSRLMGVRASVTLLESNLARVPMALGWLRPVILAPAEMVTGLTAAEIQAILAHELAHIRRHDYLVNLLQHVAETMLFFHPAVWWVSAQIRRERECCCDAEAAAVCEGVAPYARALMVVESMRAAPALAMAASGGSLLERVRRLAGDEEHSRRSAGAAAALVGAIAATVLLALSGQSIADDEAASMERDPQAASSEDGVTDDEATALAVAAHKRAAALGRLPALNYEISYRNGDLSTMELEDEYSLDNLRRALIEPVADDKWITHTATLAWTDRQAMFEQKYFKLRDNEGARIDHCQTYFGDRAEGWCQETYERQPPVYFRRTSFKDFWLKSSPIAFAFLATTPREFWWGDTYGHTLGHNPVPPAMVSYRHLGEEEIDGEPCDVVESKGRAERLWISRESGRIRAVMRYIYQGRMDTGFYKHPAVESATGRTFKSDREYRDWYNEHRKDLRPEQEIELSKAFYESYFDEMAREAHYIVFSDYREIAPDVWLPFKEDRTVWHHSGPNEEKFKYIRCEARVTKATTDVDLSERIASLAPEEGARVQDQRFDGAVVEYPWRDDITAEEIDSLVVAKRLELDKSRKLIDQLKAPLNELVGKPAPPLPDEGWIGERPQLNGKPYLIHFWAEWCGPCKNDLQILPQVARTRAIIGVHAPGSPREKVEAAIAEAKLNYPSVIAAKSNDELVGGYPVKMYPYCVVVDAEGRVAAHGALKDVAQTFGDLHTD